MVKVVSKQELRRLRHRWLDGVDETVKTGDHVVRHAEMSMASSHAAGVTFSWFRREVKGCGRCVSRGRIRVFLPLSWHHTKWEIAE